MYALISPQEIIYNYNNPPEPIGQRVAQVSENETEVTTPLYWMPCNNNVVADYYYYNTTTNQILEKPFPPPVVLSFALISPNDKIYDNSYNPAVLLGFRIVEVSSNTNSPPAPLYWVSCPNNVTSTGYYYTGSGFAPLPAGVQ